MKILYYDIKVSAYLARMPKNKKTSSVSSAKNKKANKAQ